MEKKINNMKETGKKPEKEVKIVVVDGRVADIYSNYKLDDVKTEVVEISSFEHMDSTMHKRQYRLWDHFERNFMQVPYCTLNF